MGTFTRPSRLIERLFPGNVEVPGTVGTFVQPVWDMLGLRLGEVRFRSQRVQGIGTGADLPLPLEEPPTGFAQLPQSLGGYHDSATAIAATSSIIVTGSLPDVWGIWNLAGNIGGTLVGAELTGALPLLQVVTHGNAFRPAWRKLPVGVTGIFDYLWLEVPTELVLLK
jgi:hypothetical protein